MRSDSIDKKAVIEVSKRHGRIIRDTVLQSRGNRFDIHTPKSVLNMSALDVSFSSAAVTQRMPGMLSQAFATLPE